MTGLLLGTAMAAFLTALAVLNFLADRDTQRRNKELKP